MYTHTHFQHAGMECGVKMVLTSAIGSLEEAGHEDLTDAVYSEALRRGALDGYWSAGASLWEGVVWCGVVWHCVGDHGMAD